MQPHQAEVGFQEAQVGNKSVISIFSGLLKVFGTNAFNL